jgi:hypothetical protein
LARRAASSSFSPGFISPASRSRRCSSQVGRQVRSFRSLAARRRWIWSSTMRWS